MPLMTPLEIAAFCEPKSCVHSDNKDEHNFGLKSGKETHRAIRMVLPQGIPNLIGESLGIPNIQKWSFLSLLNLSSSSSSSVQLDI